MKKVILHCDLNCFFASVEMKLNPYLKNQPLAIYAGPSKDKSIILAKNQLAKKANVLSAEPVYLALKKCPELILMPARYSIYEQYSRAVMDIYLQYTDKVESFGIDECWLDITDSIKYFGTCLDIVLKIKKQIKKELKLTVSIGVSYNKIYAKLGSDIASDDSYVFIDSLDDIKHLKANAMLGVGNKLYQKLKSYNIETIEDLANLDYNSINGLLGKYGQTLYCYIHGLKCDIVQNYYEKQDENKTLSHNKTFAHHLTTISEIEKELKEICKYLTFRLKEEKLYYKTIALRYKNSYNHSFSFQKTLKNNTNLKSRTLHEATALFKENIALTVPIKSLGISVSSLSKNKDNETLSLFEKQDFKEEKLDDTVKYIQDKYGYKYID